MFELSWTSLKRLTPILLLLLAVGCERKSPPKVARARTHSPAPVVALAQVKPRQAIYPYSVVPGGVHTVMEFSNRPDAVARRHYAGLRAAAIVENPRNGAWYVSFRKGDAIYWTSRRMAIPAREQLVQLTGSNQILFARTRCGNLLSQVPQQPILSKPEEEPIIAEADHEVPTAPAPDPPAMGDPVVPSELRAAADLPASVEQPSKSSDPGAWPFAEGYGFAGGGGGLAVAKKSHKPTDPTGTPIGTPITTPVVTPVVTPEPSGYWLVLGAFAGACLVLLTRGTRGQLKSVQK